VPPSARGIPLQANPATNPQFYNWNVAFLGYCDGGSYAGGVAAPVAVGPATIFYRGHFILESFLRKLLSVGVGEQAAFAVSSSGSGSSSTCWRWRGRAGM
jgi:hypothetical protein